ncbi:allophanate hydrolase [Nocardioides sp. Root122]|uniref:5-oxoprolinase subunit C family protein n=1 Tax=Nocardioides TaxID=1839 RepID=UPI0007032188|nr:MULTISPECIES: biotin-dependent carboxyltransferase family protein [Nocardioides]KQV71325.1 allophanate hydrolase [Nocardioides sp. Root122]MCK9822719.1 biotin-dependent carboxyltransferase family protein [Nocardioides cavernae]
MTARALEVVATGPLATIQDLGRPGLAALGVGRSGAADTTSMELANRLVGNEPGTACVEVTFGGLEVVAHGGLTVALAGAPCPMSVDGRQVAPLAVVWVPDGATLRLGAPTSGLRSYLAVRGGLDVPAVLGSRSTDTLSGVGPAVLEPGRRLRVGRATRPLPGVDVVPVRVPDHGDLWLRVARGPRADWFTDESYDALLATPYEVTAESNRVGMRLSGATLERSRDEELPSEGMVPGALQVPPSGQPTLFLADHPVTGGYPVVAVVVRADVGLAAQARPGQQIRFRSDAR